MVKYKNWNEIPIGLRFLVFFKKEEFGLETQGDSQWIIKFKRVPFSERRIYYSSEKVIRFEGYTDKAKENNNEEC